MERRLAKEGDYEITLLWLPGKESEAKVCITGPDMPTVHIPLEEGWPAFTSAVASAWMQTLFFGGSLFEEDEKVCATCKHFDIERDGYECDIHGIAESIWSCKMWEAKE